MQTKIGVESKSIKTTQVFVVVVGINSNIPRPRTPTTPSRNSSIAPDTNRVKPPPPPPTNKQLQPPKSDIDSSSQRSPSPNPSARRISFANSPHPDGNKIWISTKSDSLASGFEYDPRLNKYKVSEEEWSDFNGELLTAADVSGPIWMWVFRKKEVIKRIRRDLQYDGNVKRVLKKWNKLFKRQRFQAWLELPGQKSDDLPGNADGEKVNVKRFRIVITPNKEQRAPSVYSRNSSMTRSVTGEGVTAVMARKKAGNEEE